MTRTTNGTVIARAVVWALASFAVPFPASGQDAPLLDRGRALLESNCARCHATGKAGASALAEAPPFRELHTKYNVELLAEALAEGIVSGHPAMPEFVFPPDDIDAIIAYMKSLSGH